MNVCVGRCKSAAFIQTYPVCLYWITGPHFRILKYLPELSDIESFYLGVNKVEPIFIWVHTDELTYSLYPIIRFEIEKETLEDKIRIDDIPEV